MSYNLFLDDIRIPKDVFFYMPIRDYLLGWEIVRSYEEFTSKIEARGLPKLISFDHDLADIHYQYQENIPYDKLEEKTGYHCARWLIEYCTEKKLKLPSFLVHSWNPVGTENIIRLLQNYKKFQKDELNIHRGCSS